VAQSGGRPNAWESEGSQCNPRLLRTGVKVSLSKDTELLSASDEQVGALNVSSAIVWVNIQ